MPSKNKKASKTKERRKRKDQQTRALRRANKQREKQKAIADAPLPTSNAKLIRDLMVEKKVKGNWKDYVIIVGNHLTNWKNDFEIRVEEGKTLGVDGVALIHKRNLSPIIGDEQAKRFWHPQFGRLMEVPEGTKPSEKPSKGK